MTLTGGEKATQIFIDAYNIRIISRQRFIPGKLVTVVGKYGIDLQNLSFFPIM